MATTVKGFLDGLKTQLTDATFTALSGVGLSLVVKAPDNSVEVVEQLTNFPAAIIVDRGGQRHRSTLVLDRRRVSITIVDSIPRSAWGEETVDRLLDLGDELEDLLQADTTHGLSLLEDAEDEQCLDYEGAVQWVGKTWTYDYRLLLQAAGDIYPVPAKLFKGFSDYSSGGTSLGEKLQVSMLGMSPIDESWSTPDAFPYVDKDRRFGIEGSLLSVILAERAQKVIDLIFPGMVFNNRTVRPTPQTASGWKRGHVLPDGAYEKLLLRPNDTVNHANNYLLIERALVKEIGPVAWGEELLQFEATELIIAGRVNPHGSPAVTLPWHYGNPGDFPSLA